MKVIHTSFKKVDPKTILEAFNDMRRACASGDIPARLVRTTAANLKLSVIEFAEAAASLNRPFTTSRVR